MVTQTLTEESTSKFVQAGDIRLHYNEAGTGDVVICLHGGGPGASGWSNFNPNIGPLSADFRTILLDMPQYGKSDPVVIDGDRARFNAKAIRNMLDALNIEKVHLVGNSMGGATSIAFAIDYPERLDKLVLMGPAGGGTSIFMPRPLEGIKLLNGWYNNPTIEAMRKIVEVFVYDQKFKTDELVERRFNAAMGHPEHLEARKKSTNATIADFTSELSKIQSSTLVLWGRDDRFSPLDFALSLLWRIPNAQLHIFPECGHWCQYEKADEFNRLVLDFLRNP